MKHKPNTLATITLGVLLAGCSPLTIANPETDPQILKNIEHIKLAFKACGEISGETDQFFLDCSAQTKEEILGVINILNNPFWKKELLKVNNLNPNIKITNIQFKISEAIKIPCEDIKSNIPVILYTDTKIVQACTAGATFEKPTTNPESITPLLQQPNIQNALKALQKAKTLADALQIIHPIAPNITSNKNEIEEFIKKNQSTLILGVALVCFFLTIVLLLNYNTIWKNTDTNEDKVQRLQTNKKLQFLWRKIVEMKSALKKKKKENSCKLQ